MQSYNFRYFATKETHNPDIPLYHHCSGFLTCSDCRLRNGDSVSRPIIMSGEGEGGGRYCYLGDFPHIPLGLNPALEAYTMFSQGLGSITMAQLQLQYQLQ